MKFKVAVVTIALYGFVAAASAQEAVKAKKVSQAPEVDGVAEAVWDSAPENVIKVSKIPEKIISTNKEKQKGKYAKNWAKSKYTTVPEVKLKVVYTDDSIYFLATWMDDSKDDQHKPWKWEGDKETGEYIAGKEREDRLSFMFPIKGDFAANMLSDGERTVDVWQWKAARTNSAGIIHDKSHNYSKTAPKGKFSTHYTASGNETYIARVSDGGKSPYKSNKIDPFEYQGDFVLQYNPYVPDAPDAADVKAKGVWENGSWTVETGRKLNTGHEETDSVFDPAKGTEMSIAVFNNVGDHFHAVSQVLKIVFD